MSQPLPQALQPDTPSVEQVSPIFPDRQMKIAKRKDSEAKQIADSMEALEKAYDALAQTDHLVRPNL